MPTVNYVKAFPVLNLIQYQNVISFVRKFGQFCENFQDIRKIYPKFVKSILKLYPYPCDYMYIPFLLAFFLCQFIAIYFIYLFIIYLLT